MTVVMRNNLMVLGRLRLLGLRFKVTVLDRLYFARCLFYCVNGVWRVVWMLDCWWLWVARGMRYGIRGCLKLLLLCLMVTILTRRGGLMIMLMMGIVHRRLFDMMALMICPILVAFCRWLCLLSLANLMGSGRRCRLGWRCPRRVWKGLVWTLCGCRFGLVNRERAVARPLVITWRWLVLLFVRLDLLVIVSSR